MRVRPEHIQEAASLWSGNISQRKCAVYRSDREHFEKFSNWPALAEYDLRRFNSLSNISRSKLATGGYSIRYCFSGPLVDWVPVIQSTLQIAENLGTEGEVNNLADRLAAAQTAKAWKPLGVSAASKLLFFGAPRLCFFIFDRLAGQTLGLEKPRSYTAWHSIAANAYRNAEFDDQELVQAFQSLLAAPPAEWFRRRCFDIALIRKR